MARPKKQRTYYQYAHVTNLPGAKGPSLIKSLGGNPIVQIRNNEEVAAQLADLRRRVGTQILADPEQRAAAIQTRLRTAATAAYTKAATGRFARGLFASVQKVGSADGNSISTVIRVTMLNYRESRFLTNLGGGYFSRQGYPVRPYRIWAKGAEGAEAASFLFGRKRNTLKSGRRAIRLIRTASGVGRLKVPRKSSFFISQRRPGRGGGESRVISDLLGPADPGDRPGHFFFYPLWVNHPGFSRDVVSEIAIEEGARFQGEIAEKVTDTIHGSTTGFAVSRDIPVGGSQVTFKDGGIKIQSAGYEVDDTGKRIR